MVRTYRGLLLIPLLSGILFAAEPFHLRFPDLSQGWYPSGAVVHVPEKKAARMEVRLDKDAASQVREESLTLTMDDQYPKPIRASNSEGYLLIVKTREPVGLLVNDEHRIEATASGQHPYHGEWTILRWDKSYVQSTLAGTQNNTINIRMDQPSGGVVLAGGPSYALARFSGEILGSCDCRLKIAGQEVQRQPAKAGFQFDAQVTVSPDMQEIEVKATDDTGAMTVLYLPILRPSGR